MKKIIRALFIIKIVLVCCILLSGCSITNIAQNKTNNYDNENISNIDNTDITDNSGVYEDNNLENITDPFKLLEYTYKEGESHITSKDEINLKNTDGKKKNYSFKYNDETYTAIYTKDNWHINDSYKITNKSDIILICQALIDEHKVHGADMKSYRTADDMMDEWVRHNIAYNYLPEGNSWKAHAKDVDLNPADQGKSLKELYESRIK